MGACEGEGRVCELYWYNGFVHMALFTWLCSHTFGDFLGVRKSKSENEHWSKNIKPIRFHFMFFFFSLHVCFNFFYPYILFCRMKRQVTLVFIKLFLSVPLFVGVSADCLCVCLACPIAGEMSGYCMETGKKDLKKVKNIIHHTTRRINIHSYFYLIFKIQNRYPFSLTIQSRKYL